VWSLERGGDYVFRFRRDDGEFADWGGGFGEVEEVRQIGMRGTKVFRFKGRRWEGISARPGARSVVRPELCWFRHCSSVLKGLFFYETGGEMER